MPHLDEQDDVVVVAIAPAVEPVTLAEQKLHMRIDITDDDALISAQIGAARQTIEHELRRTLITTTYDLFLEAFPPGDKPIVLPAPPLLSVTDVFYTPNETPETTFASSNYIVDDKDEPGKIVLKRLKEWPGNELSPVNGVRVRFVAGYGVAGSNVPKDIIAAIKLFASHLYENREEVTTAVGGTIRKIPEGVGRLLMTHRVLRF